MSHCLFPTVLTIISTSENCIFNLHCIFVIQITRSWVWFSVQSAEDTEDKGLFKGYHWDDFALKTLPPSFFFFWKGGDMIVLYPSFSFCTVSRVVLRKHSNVHFYINVFSILVKCHSHWITNALLSTGTAFLLITGGSLRTNPVAASSFLLVLHKWATQQVFLTILTICFLEPLPILIVLV